MSQEPLVSVIVPVYNTEPYLPECVESLIGQTYRHCEIILVDDGSTDASGGICERYAAADPRIKVIHKPNCGLSDARNRGLDIATGEYICFVDADDVALPRMVEALLDECLTAGAAYAQGKSLSVVSTGHVRLPAPPYHRETMSGLETVRKSLYQDGLNNSSCGGLYAAGLWENLRFRKGIWFEDLDIFYRLIPAGATVAVTAEPVYLYRQHGGSFMHRFTPSQYNVLDVTDRMLQWVSGHRPELVKAARTRRLSAHINVLGLLTQHKTDAPQTRQRCLDVIAEDGGLCAGDPLAKRSLRMAMKLYRLTGPRLFAHIIAAGYNCRKYVAGALHRC